MSCSALWPAGRHRALEKLGWGKECLENPGLPFPTWFKGACGGMLLPPGLVRKEQWLSTLPPLYSSLPPKQVVMKTFAIPKGLSGHSKH